MWEFKKNIFKIKDVSCDTSIITSINYRGIGFTINGTITSDVWLEYSTDSGVTYTRLPTAFPAGSSITTIALPTGVDLKIRLVPLCDETKISNVFDYNPITPPTYHTYHFSSPGRNSSALACNQNSFPTTIYSSSFPLDYGAEVWLDTSLTTPFNGGGLWYKEGIDGVAFRIGDISPDSNIINDFYNC